MYLNISIPEEIRENTLQILNDVATEVKDTEISYVHKYSEYQITRIPEYLTGVNHFSPLVDS